MIDWRKKIKDNDRIDLQALPYYFIKFSEKSKIQKCYEYDVILPEEPRDEDCVNYGLPIQDQIFRKTYIPKQILYPNKNFGSENWTQDQKDKFIEREYNRRFNGLFIFIKGRKYYIPGTFYFFLNYWKSQTGEEFIYKFTDLEFYLIWMYACYSPKIFGLFDFKCRQIGDTEKVISMIYEYTSRVRGVKACMQSINLEHIEATYDRIIHGHKNMIYYMKPINQGSDDPRNGLQFNYPSENINLNTIKRQAQEHGTATQSNLDYEYPEINSQILYGPSKPKFFDGQTYGRAYNDEFGKNENMDPNDWIKVLIEAMRSRIMDKKMGMIIGTSTVEDMKSGDTLKNAKKVWAQCDPNNLTSEGETINGCIRIFRGALDRAPVDRWGFPKKEEELEKINSKVKAMMMMGDIRGMIDYKRKNCVTIEDVFKSTNDESQFDIEKLQNRLFFVENESEKKLYVRGNFKWKDGIKDTQVIWEPNKNGRWVVSKHPNDYGLESNARVLGVLSPKPANIRHFCAGVDPIDQQTTLESEPSQGAICVKAKLNEALDGSADRYYQFTDETRGIFKGDPVDGGANFISNRIVCTYLYRHPDPVDFFEDVIMTMVYYGTDFLPEKDRFGGLHTHLKNRGYELYLMDRPSHIRNAKGQTEQHGVSATTGNINTYFEYLTTLSCKWANTIDHPDVLEQMLTMNWQNRGKKDLGVAVGWCEYASAQPTMKYTRQEQQRIHHFSENYV